MSKRILLMECNSGISGDMTVAALLDLGADEQALRNGLKSLQIGGYEIEIGRAQKSSIDVCDFNVILESDIQKEHGHTHDDHLHHEHHHHDHSHGDHTHHHHTHDHDHNHEHEHTHGHSQSQDHHEEHFHRNLHDITAIIERANITDKAKELAKKIFYIVAESEAKAHNRPIDEVHFHEVGAIDSIVDIVGAAICLDNLNIDEVIIPALSEGTGTVVCQHGELPVPVPAVVNITEKYQIPLRYTGIPTELITPTGAAIAAAIRTGDQVNGAYRIAASGFGGGKKDTGGFNALRALLLEVDRNDTKETVWELSANIDDCSGEALSYTMDLLFEKGALDVYYIPIFMKKNRPAYMMNILCREEKIAEMEEIMFINTTTIGIRRKELQRTALQRSADTVSTKYGEAKVKVCEYEGHRFVYPEYESVKELSRKSGAGFQEVFDQVKGQEK